MSQANPVEQAGKRLVFEDSVEVPASVEEVYSRWSDFTSFPDFMSNVEAVEKLGGNRYHWVARIFGAKTEWDAEVTDQEPDRRISWRSTSGPYNAGTVEFTPTGDGKTEVRLRLEYTPPGGKAGQMLDSIAQVTRKEVKEDLRNFKRLMQGQQELGVESSESEQAGEGIGRVLISLAPPAAGALIGGLTAYYVERAMHPRYSMDNLGHMMRHPRAYINMERLGFHAQRLGQDRLNLALTREAATPWVAVGWAFTGLSAASIAAGATLRFLGRKNDALFVGQWAPTFLGLGIFSRLLGTQRVVRPGNAVTSWSFFGASLGSILTSAFWRITGKRKDSLFVGQWAPTMLTAAIVSRLFRR
jgi:uncharacterized membrane protein